jgi:hypothetical protein
MRQFLQTIAKMRMDISNSLNRIPVWHEVVRIAAMVCSPVVGLARAVLRIFPRIRRMEWLLEIESLTKRHPVVLALTMLYVVWRGLQTTNLGHIGTDPILYPLMGAISGFNPFLGLVCGALYGIGDLAQKLVWPDMYGAQGWTDANYWGGMAGYVVAYSSVMIMGIFPGMLSRVFRALIRVVLQKLIFRHSAASADGAVPLDAGAYPLAELIAAAVGAYLGGYLVMHQVAPVTESPAFYWRPHPDVSCHNLEVNTHLKGRAGIGGFGSAVGGATTTVAPPGGSGASYGPEHAQALKDKQDALDELDRTKKQWEDSEKSADPNDPNYGNLKKQYQDYTDYLKQKAADADAKASAITQAVTQAADAEKNTKVLHGLDGQDYTVVYDPKSGKWMHPEWGTEFDPGKFDEWQRNLADQRKWSADEMEKMRQRKDAFSKEMDAIVQDQKAKDQALKDRLDQRKSEEMDELRKKQDWLIKQKGVADKQAGIWSDFTSGAENIKSGADLVVDILSNFTGPVGKSIKLGYDLIASPFAEHIGEATVKGNWAKEMHGAITDMTAKSLNELVKTKGVDYVGGFSDKVNNKTLKWLTAVFGESKEGEGIIGTGFGATGAKNFIKSKVQDFIIDGTGKHYTGVDQDGFKKGVSDILQNPIGAYGGLKDAISGKSAAEESARNLKLPKKFIR